MQGPSENFCYKEILAISEVITLYTHVQVLCIASARFNSGTYMCKTINLHSLFTTKGIISYSLWWNNISCLTKLNRKWYTKLQLHRVLTVM